MNVDSRVLGINDLGTIQYEVNFYGTGDTLKMSVIERDLTVLETEEHDITGLDGDEVSIFKGSLVEQVKIDLGI